MNSAPAVTAVRQCTPAAVADGDANSAGDVAAGPTSFVAADLAAARKRTLRLVAALSDEDLHRPLDAIMSPLVWDLGHIAAYEDLWAVHRLGGEPLLRPELAAVYSRTAAR